MPITRTLMVDDDGSGTTGTILNNAWKQEFYNQIDALGGPSAGAWTAIPFNAANFTASSGVWTVTAGNVAILQWTILGGKTLAVCFKIAGNASLSLPTTALVITLPAPVPAVTLVVTNPVTYYVNGTSLVFGTGFVEVQAGTLRIYRDLTNAQFPAVTAGGIFLYGQILIPL